MKVAPFASVGGRVKGRLQREYVALERMQRIFAGRAECATLTPLACFAVGGREVLVTRWFEGANLVDASRSADAQSLLRMYRMAGMMLRGLHDACPEPRSVQAFDAADKLDYLATTYADGLRDDPVMMRAFARLQHGARELAQQSVRRTSAHGDFKPENVLYADRKMVLLDTELTIRGAFVYDLASFLDHVRLASRGWCGGRLQRHDRQVEAAFLEGYGGVAGAELSMLRWAELYFMLSYYGRYLNRGWVAATYARLRLRPLLEGLMVQVRSTQRLGNAGLTATDEAR